MKYGLPSEDGKTVSAVFGRAKSFAIYDTAGSGYVLIPNEGAASEHGAGTGAAAFLAGMGIGVVIAPEIGPKATEALKSANIGIEYAKAGMALDDAIGLLHR